MINIYQQFTVAGKWAEYSNDDGDDLLSLLGSVHFNSQQSYEVNGSIHA